MYASLDGIITIQSNLFKDNRGFFSEIYEKKIFTELGINDNFIQDNHSRSMKNVIRGMHFTLDKPQSQLLTVISGEIYDVVVDIRPNSNTYGKWMGVLLSEAGVKQIYMPEGFAHGFCVLSNFADLHYKVSQKYNSNDDHGILWNDKNLNINWPITNPIISEKDKNRSNFNIISQKIKNKKNETS